MINGIEMGVGGVYLNNGYPMLVLGDCRPSAKTSEHIQIHPSQEHLAACTKCDQDQWFENSSPQK